MHATPLRILIVDDHAENAHMLELLLGIDGHDAAVALDGPSAIAAVRVERPDVVLLDLELPGPSGIEVAAELRRHPELAPDVLVAVSGHGPEEVPHPSPFDEHFTKPLDFAALLAYLAAIRARRPSSCRNPAVASP
jgi:CheY-like chemotaxis protein